MDHDLGPIMAKRKSGAVGGNVMSKPPAGGGGGDGVRKEKARKVDAAQTSPSQSWMSPAAIRELVESVVVAFVLAFLFRTFEAEAFVIPTGSMAPTLMGRHRDVRCAQCGYPYQANASSEVDARTNQLTGREVVSGTCPMCRFTMDIAPRNPQKKPYPSFKGDRIIVAKFPYQFGEPQRWDVAVFKFPGGAKTNYIKRVVGKPNETLSIRHGDVFIKPDGQEQASIAQKPPEKVVAMMQPVYDNDYVVPQLLRRGLPARWSPASSTGREAGRWKASEDLKSFRIDGTSSDDEWLRYRHCVPSYRNWQTLQGGADLPPMSVRGRLVTDFVPYNTERVESRGHAQDLSADTLGLGESASPETLGLHWVGDLVLECTVSAEQAGGRLLMGLVKAGKLFRCELDLATGQATLSIDGVEPFRAGAPTRCRGAGEHRVRFANVDQRLLLWIDGSPVSFDSATSYWPLDDSRPQAGDLEPARIGSRGAAVRVSHIKLFRDVYYIAQRGAGTSPMCDYDASAGEFPYYFGSADPEEKIAEFFSSPEAWDAFKHRRQVDFHLAEDQFLVFGDNSAQSMDSRLWEQRGPQYYVDRDLLIGKALYIYWPHSWDTIPGTEGLPLSPNGIWFPVFPNFARMRAVR
jgi:signal peptidase I